jgi:hypothetical protein
MKRILVGFTYSMFMLAETAQRSGVRIVLPRTAAFVGHQLGLEVVDLPSFRNTSDAAAELNRLIEKHNIDAFWPLAACAYDLSGVTAAPVHAVCKHETFQMVNDKVTFANWLKDSMFRPEGVQTVGAEKTIIEVLTRLEKGQTVCIKPPRGVNGGLYWQISHDANLLADPAERKISPRAFEIALRERERSHGLEPWLVMEVLQGPELSIDALCIEGDLRKWMIREKDSPSTQIVRSDHEIIAHVRHIVKALGLHGLVSVQYMFDKDGRIKILEINLRPSGGCIGYGEVALGQAGTSDLVTDWLQYMAGMITSKDIKPWKGEVRIKIQSTASLA